jgi:hypothetical protein
MDLRRIAAHVRLSWTTFVRNGTGIDGTQEDCNGATRMVDTATKKTLKPRFLSTAATQNK